MGMFEFFTKSRILIGSLAALVLLESGYILMRRHPTNRFKPVDEDAYLAFDSATGQLCRTFRQGPRPKGIKPEPEPTPSTSSSHSGKAVPVDEILEAIQKADPEADAKAEEKAQAEFIRGLPACADIR